MNPRKYLLVLAVTVSVISGISGASWQRPACDCVCPSINKFTMCDNIARLRTDVSSNVAELQYWAQFRRFIEHFSENWRDEVAFFVETKIKDYISKGKLHGKPENLEILNDGVLSDSTLVLRPNEEDNDLAKNVSTLLEKVEMVENRTMVVENELKTERRVRRGLEEKVNKAHSSLVFIEDQLLNVSAPVDAMLTEVELKLYASIDDLNKTIYEDHLKKLYYQVDGVVYKNETKKFDQRLETIEEELHVGSNTSIVSKLAKELKSLEEDLHHLNSSIGDVVVPSLQTLNSSIGGVVIPRIVTLEVETVRKDVAEDLEDRMTNLVNDTETFKIDLVKTVSSVQDVQNATLKYVEKKFQVLSEHLTRSLEAMQEKIDHLKDETFAVGSIYDESDVLGISKLVQLNTTYIIDSEGGNNASTEYETSYTTESEAVTPTEPETYSITEFEIKDFTESESNDIVESESSYITESKNNDITESESNDITEFESNDITESESNDITESESNDTIDYGRLLEEPSSSEPNFINTDDRARIGKDLDKNSTDCDVPAIDDPHLLVDVVQNEDGTPTLKFGCRPIGRYVVPPVPVPPRCQDGFWRTPVPSCTELRNETAIKSLAEELLKEHPCKAGSGEYPDPTNCTQFFKCAHRKAHIIPCPHGLHFNAVLKVCDYPRVTECYYEKSKNVEELQALIPPIHIEPDNLDRISSHLATGKTGQLIVHPRASFTLHCLYPESIYGDPKWNVTYHHTGVISRELSPKKGNNRVSLTVTAAKEEDSGVYRCFTPFGLMHDLEVIVKAVVCPALPEEDDYEDVFYRPTPEGELRILGTTAEVLCEEGHSVIAQCMVSGEWSTEVPLKQECTPKKRTEENTWNCKPLDLTKHPDLITEKLNDDRILRFKCAGRKRLIGNTFTRCLDDGSWSHAALPKCKE